MSAVSVDALAWQDRASCKGTPISIWFGDDGELPEDKKIRETAAKAICATCAVRAICRDYALTSTNRFGVLGGTGEDERPRLRENHRRKVHAAQQRELRKAS